MTFHHVHQPGIIETIFTKLPPWLGIPIAAVICIAVIVCFLYQYKDSKVNIP